jgi:predicted DNA repair protein MutK
MDSSTSEFFSKATVQLLWVGGFYVAFFGFAKYMEYREVQKAAKARRLKKSKKNNKAKKDDLVEVPPFLI